MNIYKTILSFFLSLNVIPAFGAEAPNDKLFKGVVVDSQSNEPIAFASIFLPDYGFGAKTDIKGYFSIKIKDFTVSINKVKVSCVGYKAEIITQIKTDDKLTVRLTRESQDLREVVVKKQKYQNNNNPAVDLIEHVIANKNK